MTDIAISKSPALRVIVAGSPLETGTTGDDALHDLFTNQLAAIEGLQTGKVVAQGPGQQREIYNPTEYLGVEVRVSDSAEHLLNLLVEEDHYIDLLVYEPTPDGHDAKRTWRAQLRPTSSIVLTRNLVRPPYESDSYFPSGDERQVMPGAEYTWLRFVLPRAVDGTVPRFSYNDPKDFAFVKDYLFHEDFPL